jgi:para-aminobenzoate synthetase component 2
MTRILVVDNYDSFVYNLVQYIGQLGVDVVVRRNDDVTPADLAGPGVDGVLISPGPGMPQDAGNAMALVTSCAERELPLFGVCLGHQAIGAVFGAPIVRAPELLHGKTSEVLHEGAGVLAGLPSPFTATRYHSLAVEESALPSEILVTGRTASGVVMALQHASLPIDGVQFHPESVLTHGGHRIVANWLERCGATIDWSRVHELGADVDTLRSARRPGAIRPTSVRRSACAPVSVAARTASAGVSPISRTARAIASGIAVE